MRGLLKRSELKKWKMLVLIEVVQQLCVNRCNVETIYMKKNECGNLDVLIYDLVMILSTNSKPDRCITRNTSQIRPKSEMVTYPLITSNCSSDFNLVSFRVGLNEKYLQYASRKSDHFTS